MSHFLEPIYYVLGLMGNLGKTILGAINKIRAVFVGLKKRIKQMVGGKRYFS